PRPAPATRWAGRSTWRSRCLGRRRWPAGWPSTRRARAGLAWRSAAPGAGAYLDPAALTEDDERALAAWLADPARPKAMHDAKGPFHALAAHGLELAGLTTDTALAA